MAISSDPLYDFENIPVAMYNGMTPDQSYFYLDYINTYDFCDSVTLSDIWFDF